MSRPEPFFFDQKPTPRVGRATVRKKNKPFERVRILNTPEQLEEQNLQTKTCLGLYI